MSFILNLIKERVQKSIKVEVLTAKYGKYPVVVTDTSNSVTSGWSLTYHPQKSKFGKKLHEPRERFSEITIINADSMISDLSTVYAFFMKGEGVTEMYGTNTASYQPNDKLWFTCIQRPKGVNITVTVTDENSPFHMLQVNFFVLQNGDQNRHPIYGYDYCYNAETNTWTDRRDNASMTPSKKQVVPIYQESQNGPKLVKVAGSLAANGMVAINEEHTKIEYVQEATNERKLLASIYEKMIMEVAFEYAVENLPSESQYNGNFGNSANAGQSWTTSNFNNAGFSNVNTQANENATNQSNNGAFGQNKSNQSFGMNSAQGFGVNAFNNHTQQNEIDQNQPVW